MPTQRQWGAALISVTCPCASHQLHYASVSHASPANWIACEVVTRTGARATSVPPLLQKREESFPQRHRQKNIMHYQTETCSPHVVASHWLQITVTEHDSEPAAAACLLTVTWHFPKESDVFLASWKYTASLYVLKTLHFRLAELSKNIGDLET